MPTVHAAPLPKPQRTQLENTVKAAREVAEKGARAALAQLAVAEGRAPDYLSDDHKALRRRLRAHGRALGDAKADDDTQAVQQLVWEVAYEHWHRMLFACFLAENGLLLWEIGAAVSLDDCEALVQETDPAMNLGARTQWELAGKLAARMLPQVFKPQSPVFELAFAPEHQRELERLLSGLPTDVFQASDSLGWVYQFWQAKRKDEVNASEVKIGADELPAVTQLFTEPYMVDFLLHNSLGAWWATRHPGQPCPVPLTYLRTLEDGTPAAGPFEGWPDSLQDFTLLDPCCGSGHFLVAAFLLLVPMRMAAEGLTALDAVDAVLADNLHGLELDPRCVEIAVFALALAAWRYLDEDGHPLGVRADMPAPQIACCGLKLNASAEDWSALVPESLSNKELVAQDLRALQADFAQAPLLGSLLDPARSLKDDLATSNVQALRDLLAQALAQESSDANSPHGELLELALSARGLLDAARLLQGRYHLVITNVPYLARGKQNDTLKAYCAQHFPDAKNDLANVFLERCLELAHPPQAGQGTGVVQIVMPQNWLFLTSYKKQRESLLQRVQWNLLARLGEGGFDSPQAAGAFIILLTQSRAPTPEGFALHGVDASAPKSAPEKALLLREGAVVAVSQTGQLGNPDARVSLSNEITGVLLNSLSHSHHGLVCGDRPRMTVNFWEVLEKGRIWIGYCGTVVTPMYYGGKETYLRWCEGTGAIKELKGATNLETHAWGRRGIVVSAMRDLQVTLYTGMAFDNNTAVITAHSDEHLPAIWCFCSSPEYNEAVRQIDQALKVTNATLVKVPFDLAHWQQVAAERYPHGLPKPYSDDPTQWLFHGHPQPATDPLQVAVARLVGYRWPAEQEAAAAAGAAEIQAKLASGAYVASASSYQSESIAAATTAPQRAPMELSEAAHAWIARCAALEAHTDDDGICCLPSVRGEAPAHERLLQLLIASWETVEPGSWRPAILDQLLAQADCAGKGLDVWLREKFFEQHAKRFHHRPFVWHVWDGLKDGFAALVNYHRLDTKNLERLIHTYLGAWIGQQEKGVRDGVDGAQTRLAAAQDLKRRLELILEGEPPYDIFVRWKSLAEQPIGWNPDLNDGVRLNIRPFMTAEVLRHNRKPKLNITWDKDRGKDVESAPWFGVFGGDRINDHHLTLAEKRAARGAA
ncbi:restriction endonuclease subunit M [Acidovorax carolinensis]|uniref:site-specific DNA-methyltransferase (adenine-specific) n=1 Tax=Acidovorax carolinensis TaxID=553814 RepID=A0A240UDL3_9BURK|nr:DNA methyltransferase [Acidovorax carolinensis]ART55102.1 restriction endonuclease subunit M [Acidovorax carolinensis]ART59142.1 restriction endonuclease subunit M [Acidovorax carolinensis]